MIELVVTIIILGIVASIAGPKFFASYRFAEMGFADSAATAFRYAQKIALASGCDTRVALTTTDFSLYQRANSCDSGAFNKAVLRPGGQQWVESVPNGVSVTPVDIYFDSVGRPHEHASGNLLTSAMAFNVGARSVTIEAETGYVHQ